MQLGNNNSNISSGNRSVLILVIILAVLIVILLGVLYFMKQRDMGEGAPGSLSGTPKVQIEKHTVKELMDLTSAPENNPDIKPNPALTAMTSAPESNISAKADSDLMANLTAPKN